MKICEFAAIVSLQPGQLQPPTIIRGILNYLTASNSSNLRSEARTETMLYTLVFLLLAANGSAPSYGFSPGRRGMTRPRSISTSHADSRFSIKNSIREKKSHSPPQAETQRRVLRIEKFARLPVWPVWQGVFLFVASKIFGEEVAAGWEDRIGGRVAPNFFVAQATSPFVLLVHHRHSFSNWDPIRYIQRTFFPEGFPSHPHRGFITVTYCLKGGMVHRDSLGIKQSYGAEKRHRSKHVQWLTAGAGIQHEEMWDIEPDGQDEGKWLWSSSQELYQLWVNMPSDKKMSKPNAELLEACLVSSPSSEIPDNATPIIVFENTITTVIAGEHNGIRAPIDCPTNVAIMRVQLLQNKSWTHNVPSSHETAIIYVRKGSIQVGTQRVPPHYTAYLTSQGGELSIQSLDGGADILLLSGEPLREPIASQGSMVMNTNAEIQQAYVDYQLGKMGLPWSEKLSDDEWLQHIKTNPSVY